MVLDGFHQGTILLSFFFCLTALFFSGVYSRLGLDPRGSSKAEPLWIAGAVPKVSHGHCLGVLLEAGCPSQHLTGNARALDTDERPK